MKHEIIIGIFSISGKTYKLEKNVTILYHLIQQYCYTFKL